MCKNWAEYDDERGMFEYCKGAEKKVCCCGDITRCHYPDFYNAPRHRWPEIRRRVKAIRLAKIGEAIAECGVKL